MHAAGFSHILTIFRHYYILSKTMVNTRQICCWNLWDLTNFTNVIIM